MAEQEPKRVKVESSVSVVEIITFCRTPWHRCIAVEGCTAYVPCTFVFLAILWSQQNVDAEVRAQLKAHLQTDDTRRTPHGNTLFMKQLLLPWWPVLKQYILRLHLLCSQFEAVLQNQAPVASLLPWIPITRLRSTPVTFLSSKDCPLSGLPIRRAVRPSSCNHDQCVDLDSYIQHWRERINVAINPLIKNEPGAKAKKPACPICHRELPFIWFLFRDLEFERQIQQPRVELIPIALD